MAEPQRRWRRRWRRRTVQQGDVEGGALVMIPLVWVWHHGAGSLSSIASQHIVLPTGTGQAGKMRSGAGWKT